MGHEAHDLRKEQFEAIIEPHLPGKVSTELDAMSFFTTPGSIGYHGYYEGGLYDHSYAMAMALVDLTKKLDLEWERPESPYIVGSLHDLCKCDNYRKDDVTGEWGYDPACLMPGHGEKSVMMAMKLFELTDEEILCIRWHMGAFDSKDNWDYYNRAVHECPNVLYTHTTDMIASQIIGT